MNGRLFQRYPQEAGVPKRFGERAQCDLKRAFLLGPGTETLDFLHDRFGKSGSWYYDIARGRDDRPVQPDRERKSSGSETTFPEDLTDPVQIEAGVIAMADDVWAWCEKANSWGRTVTVKIKWADFQISTRSRSMETTIQTRDKLHQAALDLIRSVFPPPKGVRLVGVTLSKFRSQTPGEVAGAFNDDHLGTLDAVRGAVHPIRKEPDRTRWPTLRRRPLFAQSGRCWAFRRATPNTCA